LIVWQAFDRQASSWTACDVVGFFGDHLHVKNAFRQVCIDTMAMGVFHTGFSNRWLDGAMPARSARTLEFHRDAHRVTYRLEGRDLNNGDPLEIWTTLGWVQGIFTWEGESHLPYISLPNHGQGSFVILTSSLCRRPLQLR
jgi:hypothetical protein